MKQKKSEEMVLENRKPGKGVDLLTLFNMQDTETDNVEITCEGIVILLKYNISVSTPGIYLDPDTPPPPPLHATLPHITNKIYIL